MIDVKPHSQGAILPVRAKPGAKSDGVVDERHGALLVSVTTAPEQGKANDAIIRVLAHDLGCKRSQIELLSGATSRNKAFLFYDLSVDELLSRIDSALTPTIYDPLDDLPSTE